MACFCSGDCGCIGCHCKCRCRCFVQPVQGHFCRGCGAWIGPWQWHKCISYGPTYSTNTVMKAKQIAHGIR